jgi:hypothetical protein
MFGDAHKRVRRWFQSFLPPVGLVGLIYVGSYFVLSRQGFRQADAAGFDRFYFCSPDRPAADSINSGLDTLYWPLIRVDVSLGTGREAAKAPLRGLR